MSESALSAGVVPTPSPRDTFRNSGMGRSAALSRRVQAVESSESEEAQNKAAADEDLEAEEEPSQGVPGGLRVQLRWQPGQPNLCMHLRQSVLGSRLQMKCSSFLNPQTGTHSTRAFVRKNFDTHAHTFERLALAAYEEEQQLEPTEPDIKPMGWIPGGLGTLIFKDWTLSPGLVYDWGSAASSGSSAAAAVSTATSLSSLHASPNLGLKYLLRVKKSPQVIKNTPGGALWATCTSSALIDQKTSEMTLESGVRLGLYRWNVTSTQNLRVTAGLDLVSNNSGSKRTAYLKVTDKKATLKLQRGIWTVTYEL